MSTLTGFNQMMVHRPLLMPFISANWLLSYKMVYSHFTSLIFALSCVGESFKPFEICFTALASSFFITGRERYNSNALIVLTFLSNSSAGDMQRGSGFRIWSKGMAINNGDEVLWSTYAVYFNNGNNELVAAVLRQCGRNCNQNALYAKHLSTTYNTSSCRFSNRSSDKRLNDAKLLLCRNICMSIIQRFFGTDCPNRQRWWHYCCRHFSIPWTSCL